MKPRASVSLDLDDLWTYLKTHGDSGWDEYPTYLPTVVPRVLDLLDELGMRITWFVVGRDAADPRHRAVLRAITDRGHEVGNHSFRHEPWLHLYTDAEVERELAEADAAIRSATGAAPGGFRGPGFSFSPAVLSACARLGYRYDASTFPTFLGPLARLYYFATARGLSTADKDKRKQLFGSASEGFRPLKPYTWRTGAGPLLEIPVTTMPVFRAPIHLSYLLYLDGFSRTAARAYLRLALALCRAAGFGPSFLLHPLDFLGADDTDRLAFFPAMRRPAAPKLAFAREALGMIARHFTAGPMGEHADALLARPAGRPTLVPA